MKNKTENKNRNRTLPHPFLIINCLFPVFTPKLIVLDRDGVVNHDSEQFIKSAKEWRAIPGSLEAIAKLNQAGFTVVVATNQSGIARGYFSSLELKSIHKKMEIELAAHNGHFAGIFICPHRAEDNCSCRKPKPGLLLEIAKKFNIKPEEMLTIGDSMRDILAAQACNAKAILVKTGKGAQTVATATEKFNVPIFNDLAAAVDAILKNNFEFKI